MSVEAIAPYLEPLRKSVTVPCAPPDAFRLFTDRIGEWWPLDRGYSVFGDRATTCGIEPRVDGELFELSATGERAVWGRVTAWEPPGRLAFTWFPGRSTETGQTIEVTFETLSDGGTRVDLEHRDWQTLGTAAAETRQAYDAGWTAVLGRFAARAAR